MLCTQTPASLSTPDPLQCLRHVFEPGSSEVALRHAGMMHKQKALLLDQVVTLGPGSPLGPPGGAASAPCRGEGLLYLPAVDGISKQPYPEVAQPGSQPKA